MRRIKRFATFVMDHIDRAHKQTPNAGLHLFAPNGQGWRYGNGAYIACPDRHASVDAASRRRPASCWIDA